MAVAFDALSTDILFTGVNSASGTLITVGGSATLLIVGIQFNNRSGSATGTAPSGISVTWNGVAMTQISNTLATQGTFSSGNAVITVLFGLVNPATGAGHTLSATWTNNATGYMSAISFSGTLTTSVAVACPNGQNKIGAITNGGTWPFTVTTVSGDFAVGFSGDDAGQYSSQAVGANTTAWESDTSGAGTNLWAIYSTAASSGSSMVITSTLTLSGSENAAGSAVNITGTAAFIPTVGGSRMLFRIQPQGWVWAIAAMLAMWFKVGLR
jgi:hypothetical protein